MNRPSPRRLTAAALAATLLPAGVLGLATHADATTPVPGSRISVVTSDASVSSGEQFVLSGRLSTTGVVRVQSREGATWRSLPGAAVTTRSNGTYRVRVELDRTGERLLRVVGDPTAAGVAGSQARIVIDVS